MAQLNKKNKTVSSSNSDDEYYVLEFKEAECGCGKSSPKTSVLAILITLSLLIIVPCMIMGYAREYTNVIKYKDIGVSACYGGPVITGYQILPQIYNTSLTYYPARLEFQTLEVGTNRTVRMIYPTYFERTFADSCVFHSDKTGRNPCDKLVGDVITKYTELVAVAEFPCYISGGQIIGLAGEQSVIRKYYRLTTTGLVFIALDILMLVYALGSWLELGISLGGQYSR